MVTSHHFVSSNWVRKQVGCGALGEKIMTHNQIMYSDWIQNSEALLIMDVRTTTHIHFEMEIICNISSFHWKMLSLLKCFFSY